MPRKKHHKSKGKTHNVKGYTRKTKHGRVRVKAHRAKNPRRYLKPSEMQSAISYNI